LIESALALGYKEDISDFLPLEQKSKRQLALYQSISGADKLFAIVKPRNEREISPDSIVGAIDYFCERLENDDTQAYITSVMSQIDMEAIDEVSSFVYDNIPLLLEDQDFQRIDSLLSERGYIEKKIKDDKEMLMLPSSSMMVETIARDPLSLFTPALSQLSSKESGIEYETYDNYIFTPDGTRGIVILESSAGARESGKNKELIEVLEKVKKDVEGRYKDIEISIIGGPAIAVANASRIKSDGIIAGVIAGVLILLLLIYVFRNARNIFLIFFSVGWGMLFALGCLGIYYDSVSVIVLGISSVIIGLALNYPLHLIDHLKGSVRREESMREVIAPLVVGNITTVGAFLCLVPLNSVALHDLGLFSSLLLIGTILFVLIFLPHAVKTTVRKNGTHYVPRLLSLASDYSPERSRVVVGAVAILTVLFAFFCRDTRFDSDMRNINYMTPEQREDMDYFQSLISQQKGKETIYLVADGKDSEETLLLNQRMERFVDSLSTEKGISDVNGISKYLPAKQEQVKRLERWRKFVEEHGESIVREVKEAASQNGFSEEAFKPFEELISTEYLPISSYADNPLCKTVFRQNIVSDSLAGALCVINTLQISEERVEEIKESLKGIREFGADFFDVKSLNGSIADTLSDDFNYIGFVCGGIVFIFLWISLGRIELALISFLPMAVSWIWILGIMGMTGISFNIVNLILATFIFGQGDDYTIFMTEGLIYEYAYRKKILASYKNSIIVSALIMFIGIGALIFSKHPAMRSLGEVTVVGMLSVVLMAYLFPPLIFNLLVKKNGKFRKYPVTLRTLFKGTKGLDDISRVMGRY
ncbi:MAG: MMPL family transporter, partial [Muribaculaceae bacterium]|nr:MMPL family transporter [Muribaculaceae bacterium]